jgi:peptidoglycan/LPS O-acetylase OafA/YrhL
MTDRSASASDAAHSPSVIPALDGVRGLAILLVLAHNLDTLDSHGPALERAVDLVANFGWVGVQLFFVLSGFLITGILLDTQRAPRYYRAFWGRRILRIFPLYYGFLVLCLVVVPRLGLAPDRLLADAEHRIWLWTYLINWSEPLGAGVAAFPHFWSLAVEEQFYLVWPFVVRRATPRRLVQVSVALVAIAIAARLGLLVAGSGEAGPYMFTVCRMDALALGGAVAALLRIPAGRAWLERRRSWIAAVAGALFAIGLVATRGYPRAGELDQGFGYTILALVFAVIVLLAVLDHERGRGWVGAVFRTPLLRSFGKYSYAIYLFHQPLNQMIGLPLLHQRAPAGGLAVGGGYLLAVAAVSYALAVASYHGYERHFLALKRYFVPGRSRDFTAR